jgi:putative sigma-54 modulation protein
VQISISARHGQLSESTQDKIREKVEKLSRIFDRLTAIQVTVDLERRETPEVELRVSAEHKKDFVATNSSTSVLAALDAVMPKIEQQLRRYKDKVTGHKVTGLKHIEVPTESEPETETE